MLELTRGLSPTGLKAVAELERRTVATDGGRLKLEWGALNTGGGRDVQEVLWWDERDNAKLLGFLGVYSFGSPTIELAGMVDPTARRRGIGAALLEAAMPLCAQQNATQVLLVVPRASTAGRELALSRGGTLDHSEHALVLPGEPLTGQDDPTLTLRPATAEDLPEVYRILASAFDWVPKDLARSLDAPDDLLMLAELAGQPVGTLRLTRDGDHGRIYGFAVDPAFQGRGIGRAALRRACQKLRQDGAKVVGLEVAVDNERALGLYTSVGFSEETTEDYFALPLTDEAGHAGQ